MPEDPNSVQSIADLPSATRRRLARCVVTLNSVHDAAVVAAARGIVRELRRHDLAIAHLAAFIERKGRVQDDGELPECYGDFPLQQQMAVALLALVSHDPRALSDWDGEFVRSVDRQLRRRHRLSERQSGTLQRIYDGQWPLGAPDLGML
ncbi:MAG: hypothetical protein H6842_04685 [Rhodospirillaceae bacterium]|nr:hypothetical protein [Rhodospirillaceae bacterium]